ncbi:MAG: HTTM domain-containing protein [Chthoniobacterales bacterium]
MKAARERLCQFLFRPDSGRWIEVLRIGLALQVILYAWSLRNDWRDLFGTTGPILVNRALAEAVLSGESLFTPRLGWLIAAGKLLGLAETTTLSLIWLLLLGAGLALFAGVCSRWAAITAWFLYLCSVKSGVLFSYGVDNFAVIGLFYLMIAPLPKAWMPGHKLKSQPARTLERLGFHRRVLQLHLCIIYFFGGVSKCLGSDWWNGVSVWRALTRPPFDVVSPEVLIRFEGLLPLIGIGVCLLETGYPVLIWPRKSRAPWLIGILLMHISIALTMGLYLFAFIMIVLNLAAFGPGAFSPFLRNTSRPCEKTSDNLLPG